MNQSAGHVARASAAVRPSSAWTGTVQRKCACCDAGPSAASGGLRIGPAADAFEAEADRVAADVTADTTSDDLMQGRGLRPARAAAPRIQRMAAGPAPASVAHATPMPASVTDTLARPGRPLESPLRADMEQRFGHDFSSVRVHTDAVAAQSARDIGARAWTLGRDIVFDHGSFAPHTGSGRRLLAHELTHVIQQGDGRQGAIQRSPADCAALVATPSSVSFITGIVVHQIISEHFLATASGALVTSIPGGSNAARSTEGICGKPSSVIKPQETGGRSGGGLLDLARRDRSGSLRIAELKPAVQVCLVDGEMQLANYLLQGNASDAAQVTWRASRGIRDVVPMQESEYKPPRLRLQVNGIKAELRTAWCEPGLLAYAVILSKDECDRMPAWQKAAKLRKYVKVEKMRRLPTKGRRIPEALPESDAQPEATPEAMPETGPMIGPPVAPQIGPQADPDNVRPLFPKPKPGEQPAPEQLPIAARVPPSTTQMILAFIDQALKSASDMPKVVRQFLVDHPAIVESIEVTVVAIGAAAVLSDLLTFGAAAAKDPAVATALALMLKIAPELRLAR